ncbi:hypothetical protein MASR2M78_21070 [Treponema sp.]
MSLLVSISTWFLTLFRSPSIKKKIRTSHIIIIVSMLAAPVTSIMVSLFQTVRYDQIITNVSKTNQLNQIVKTSITNEIWNIVAGNKKFGEADQYEILKSIRKQLEDIKRTTQVVKNRQMLEVAGRAVNTLGNYIDRLGEQKRNHFPVSENEIILDEIRGVSALISDILQDFIVLEIESAAKTNESIKRTAWGLSLLQLVIVFLVTLFAVFAQRSVAQSINQPITELENLSTRIASGDLSARAELPNVTELDNLTENLNLMAQKIRKLLDENILEQKNLQKSEMNALQAQITPHFLYNTFDTIIWLRKPSAMTRL